MTWHYLPVTDEQTDNPWYRNVEVFPALVRTHAPHLLIVGALIPASIALTVVADRRIFAAIGLVAATTFGALVIVPLRMDTLFVSDGGLVRTNGRWMVQVAWDDLCCVRRIDDLWEKRSLLSFRARVVRPLPPRESLTEAWIVGAMASRVHLLLQSTIYGAEPDDARFGALLARHRPDLVPTGPVPISKRWQRCQHQLAPGATEYVQTWRTRCLAAFWPMAFGAGVLIAGVVARVPLLVIAGMLTCTLVLFFVGIQPTRWTLTVSPTGLTQEFCNAVALHVDWNDVTALRRVRIGLSPFASWVVEFEPRGPRPSAGQTEIPESTAKAMMKRTDGRRINLSEFGLRPDAEPLRSVLFTERPDLAR